MRSIIYFFILYSSFLFPTNVDYYQGIIGDISLLTDIGYITNNFNKDFFSISKEENEYSGLKNLVVSFVNKNEILFQYIIGEPYKVNSIWKTNHQLILCSDSIRDINNLGVGSKVSDFLNYFKNYQKEILDCGHGECGMLKITLPRTLVFLFFDKNKIQKLKKIYYDDLTINDIQKLIVSRITINLNQ